MDLTLKNLKEKYRDSTLTPLKLVETIYEAIDKDDPRIWISRSSKEQLTEYCRLLEGKSPDDLPLYGVPFAIKDNIDLAGLPTTAACPEFSYNPVESAYVVEKLIAAGAIPMGKTNLDQFATGLVGTRSPYGVPENAFHPEIIPGGSSSGSAVAVAKGLVTFSLGTDTAGSGRVPASLNNIVGLKPTRGLLSNRGLVPACRTLDCISIFGLTADDARAVLEIVAGYDPQDPYSVNETLREPFGEHLVIGIPQPEDLNFFGDEEAANLFQSAITRLEKLGHQIKRIDFQPFLEAARLLYEGPWLTERYIAIEDILKNRPEILFPVTRQIIEQGSKPSAVDAFKAEYRLRALRRQVEPVLDSVDAIMTPTSGTAYTIQEVEQDPIQLNSNLGYYTNYMNLCDLSGVAVPNGFRKDGVPMGVTFFARARSEIGLLQLAGCFHFDNGLCLGNGTLPVPAPEDQKTENTYNMVPLVVCGAHMQGLPLNHQLTALGGEFVEKALSAKEYRMYALDMEPPRPAMVRTPAGGVALAVEVWQLPAVSIGLFLQKVAAPLGLGKVKLEDGREYIGFIAESHANTLGPDISHLGGWRAYLKQSTEVTPSVS